MYSFDTIDREYKYETIQHGYEVDFYDEENDDLEISIETISEEEFDEEFAL